MGRQGGGNRGRGGKRWSRKRKADERSAKSEKQRLGGNDNGNQHGYAVIHNSNPKFEAYYSLVGLHDTRYDEVGKKFVPCVDDNEKHAERNLFMSTLAAILPSSFRVDRSLDPTIQKTLLEELRQLVGKEIELEIELPRRSAAFGGIKNVLEKGADAEAANGDEAKECHVEKKKEDGATHDEGAVYPELKNGGSNATRDKEKSGSGCNGEQNEEPVIVKRMIPPAKPIPFISTGSTVLGYQLSVDRRTIRRNKSLEPLHAWLKIQTDCGHITRQETVSMIPPVVLDVREGMSVLDMCAAPGSKTCQLLEIVGGFENASSGNDAKGINGLEPKGYVVANDADSKRAYMLVNQLRRMNSPSVFVTACDGQYFPILDDKSVRGTDEEGSFDRVLCDVPCSGDGTVRKNPRIWRQWNQLGSLALHPLQLSIGLRGARMTRVGGMMVYSTCSMNVMENESVVAELLRVADGSLVLEDPRDRMEGLIARPGWGTWRVLRESKNRTRRAMKDWRKKNNPKMKEKRKEWEERRLRGECPPPKEASDGQKDGEEKEEKFVPSPYDTIPYVPPSTWDHEALSERTTSLGFVEYASYADVEPDWRRRVRASCFPPTEEEAKRFELHKCLRCLPQDMDTGGFFVALLKKVKPLSKDAMDRMNRLAKESRGGVEVDSHLSKEGDADNRRKSENDAAADNIVMAQLSSTKENADTKPSGGCKKEVEPNKDGKGVEEEPIRKAPMGKVGVRHKHQNKRDLSKEDFIPCNMSVWPRLEEEYGLVPTFPKDQIMVRASGEAKVLYFISRSIKEQLIDRGIQDRAMVINSGLKCFERCSLQDKKVDYRLAQEGIHFVVPHMTRRILTASMADFYACVKEGFIPFDSFSETFRRGVENLEVGSFVVKLEGYEDDISKKMFLSMWRRPNKMVNCFVTKIEMEAILSKMRALGYVAKEEEKPDKKSVENEAESEDDATNVSS